MDFGLAKLLSGTDESHTTGVPVDLHGRYVIDARRITPETFHALDGRSTFQNIVVSRDSRSRMNAAFGLKANVFGRLLLDLNLLFGLDTKGLRDKVTPLVGLEYTF